jgi:hypothetical protein
MTWRDASADPGSTQFTQWIKMFSAQINDYYQVTSDICAYGDGTQQSEAIIGVIAFLLEAHFIYANDLSRTPLSERGNLKPPHLMNDEFIPQRFELDQVKGADESIDPAGFNFDTDTTTGGFD